jgi:hypothetical protein
MYYLIYQFSREIGEFTGDNTINPTLEVVLSVITCGVYGIYWCYKYSKIIYEMQMNTGVQYPNDVSLPALILPIFGLTSVALLIMQTEINKVWIKSSGN